MNLKLPSTSFLLHNLPPPRVSSCTRLLPVYQSFHPLPPILSFPFTNAFLSLPILCFPFTNPFLCFHQSSPITSFPPLHQLTSFIPHVVVCNDPELRHLKTAPTPSFSSSFRNDPRRPLVCSAHWQFERQARARSIHRPLRPRPRTDSKQRRTNAHDYPADVPCSLAWAWSIVLSSPPELAVLWRDRLTRSECHDSCIGPSCCCRGVRGTPCKLLCHVDAQCRPC